MAGWLDECSIARVLRFRRTSSCLIAIFFLTSAPVSATPQSPEDPNASRASPAASAAPAPKQLPHDLAKELSDCEALTREALHQIDDLVLIDAAIPKAERLVEIRTSSQGESWWKTIDARQDLADLRRLSTMPANQRASLAVAERAADHARNKNLPPSTYQNTSDDQAIKVLAETARTEAQILGDDHPWHAASLYRVGRAYFAQSRYAEAESHYRLALEIHHKVLGDEHPAYALDLVALAELYNAANRYDAAEPLYLRAVAIEKKTLGDENSDYATSLDELASLYVAMGHNEQAETLYHQALEIEKKSAGDESPLYAASLCNLGDLYRLMGRFAQAEPLYQQSLEIRKKILGGQSPDYARSLDRLAALYDSMGRYKPAEPLYKQAIEIRKHALGEEHPDYARSLNNLALLYKEMGRYQESEPLYRQALEIRTKALGDQHRTVASSLDDLAQLYQAMGKYEQAEPLYIKALAIRKKTLGEQHPAYAANLDNLSLLYEQMGRYAESETLCRQALEIRRTTLGEQHPQYAVNLRDLAGILAVTNRTHEASILLLRSAQLQWQHLTANFPTMSDKQKRLFLAHSQFVQSLELSSLVFQGKGADPKDGLRGVLLSKQLLFEVARQESGALMVTVASAPPDWQKLWREHERLRHEYAALALLGLSETGHSQPSAAGAESNPDHLHALARQIDLLEQELRRKNAAYATQAPLQQVTLEDVTGALREREVLLEYVRYRPYDFASHKWGDERYGVFILEGGTGDVSAIDLGPATQIDEAVSIFRTQMIESISNFGSVTPSRGTVRRSEAELAEASARLRALIWQPLEKHLASVNRAYLAPDGMLSLVPFEALARQNRFGEWLYLAEDSELIYLGTGRDLARFTLNAEKKPELARTAVLVSNPDFNADQERLAAIVAGVKPPTATIAEVRTDPTASVPTDSATLGRTASRNKRTDLPGAWDQEPVANLDHRLTEPVAAQLKGLGWSVQTLSGSEAVEEAVLGIQEPRIFQFATHGFVLDRRDVSKQTWDNPLLRSGMVMAGVNTWPAHHAVHYRAGKELVNEEQAHALGFSDEQLRASRVEVADGILTAYEVTGMNLRNTELVNLTACETGLGEVTPDGVVGLRRAFSLAGARSLTMSMWEVPAEETASQIYDFYENWLGGVDRASPSSVSYRSSRYEAFRTAQLTALARARENHGAGHPFYWAGVVFVGDPGDLPARATPSVKMVNAKKKTRSAANPARN